MDERWSLRGPEDPSVAPVEAILDRVAVRMCPGGPGPRPVAEHALWICPCVTVDDAPIWLIFDSPDGTLHWCRLPDGSKVDDVLDAQHLAGAHVEPEGVLAWLRGAQSHPWIAGNGLGDEIAARALGGRVLGG